jgi:hypothetical protein
VPSEELLEIAVQVIEQFLEEEKGSVITDAELQI